MPVAKKASKPTVSKKKATKPVPEKVRPFNEDIPRAHVISHLTLEEILPNPKNPRKTFNDGPFTELVASIREKGVLQPIIVRPRVDFADDEKKYEIVAGERRWRASATAGALTIPAIIRELSDQEAFDIMVIENLQREDLDPLEEARAFEAYAKEGGDIEDLASKIGSDPRYIRRRVRILTLPEEVLTGWRDGKISLGHLEQLMRLSRKEDILQYYKETVGGYRGGSVAGLREAIDDRSPELSTALFDTGDCETCTMNTSMQGGIFGTDFIREKVLCLNSKCFKKKQVDYLTGHWSETKTGAKFHTKGFRLKDEVKWDQFNAFWGQHANQLLQCLECENFVSIIELSGRVYYERSCVGDKQCYRSVVSGKDKSGSGASGKNTRVNDIGPEFQDKFYRERIPAMAHALPFDEAPVLRIVAQALINNSERTRGWFLKDMGIKHEWNEQDKVWKALEAMEAEEIRIWIRRIANYLTLDDMQIGFGLNVKHQMAKHLGIDIAAEWVLHKEFLQRKTIPEILAICKELKLFEGPGVKEFASTTLKLKSEKYDTLKKKDLIRLILESGIDLKGKVPKEMLKTK
ncbi:MAG: ParB/RepB/Spo0J family partition protein [Syntrophorhabdaceae bacterium]|nr:ParB/RepB/Spo0J family partition protein [Syntrophorhabdaceae bacterium]